MNECVISTPEWISSLGHYKASKPIELVAKDIGIKPEEIIMLVANENPLGMSEKVRQKISEAIFNLNRYPDADAWPLKTALAKKLNVPEDWIVLGNGSSELLGLSAQMVLSPENSAIYPQYSFSLYPMVARLCGAKTIEVPATEDFNADLDAMLAAIDDTTRLIFLTNPNNPTGTYLQKEKVEEFLDKVPEHIFVLFDEAYVEFLEPELRLNSIDLVKKHKNVLIARTFSKAYGLAGSRVGYGVAQPELLEMFNRVRHPFNVNDLSQVAALAAMEDEEFIERTLENNRKGKAYLVESFRKLGLPFMGLHANFVTVKIGSNAEKIIEELFSKGIIVRKMTSYDLPEWIRVTVGTEEENRKFIQALTEAL